MENIRNFFIKLDMKKRSAVTFADAALGGQTGAYIWYRLRYFTIKSLLMIFVHCLEFYLLFIIFNTEIAISILVFRIIGFIGSSFWWGALESFREEIRSLSQNHQKQQSALLYKQWAKGAVYFSCLLSIIILSLLAYHLASSHIINISLFCAYIVAIIIEINVRIRVLTKHASCFATNRVYRPLYSVISPPLIGLSILGILWYPLGGYSLVLAGLTQSLLALYWTWSYTRHTLRSRRLQPEVNHNADFNFKKLLNLRSLKQATAAMLMDGSGIVILIVLHDFTSFYLLAPLIATCFNWSKLFYFDNIKYEARWLRLLIERLNQTATNVSLIISLGLTLLCYLIFNLITVDHSITLLVGLFVFFISRALLSLKLIVLFTRRHYSLMIAYNSLLLAVILILSFLQLPLYQLLIFIAIAQLIIHCALYFQHMHRQPALYPELLLPYFVWLKSINHKSTISKITLSNECSSQQLKDIAQAIYNYHHGNIIMTRENKNILLYLQQADAIAIDSRWLAEQSTGLILKHCHDIHYDAAFKNHLDNCKLQVMTQFQQQFPEGYIIDLTQPTTINEHYPNQQLLSCLIHYLNQPLNLTTKAPFYCSALYLHQQLDTLFILPKSSTTHKQAADWQQWLFQVNAHNSLSP